MALGERVENLLREFDRDGGDGDAAALDVGLGADVFGDVEGALEGLVQAAAGVLVLEGEVVGFLELAEDFGFTEDHRVHAAGDLEEVLDALRFAQEIEFVGDGIEILMMVEEELPQTGEGIVISAAGGSVDFHAVAGR